MALDSVVTATFLAHPVLTAVILPLLTVALRLLYNISPFHTLAHIPAPYLPRLSSLWLVRHAWIGDEATATHKLHEKYGSIVRTGPMSVDIADGEALHAIYVEKGGFKKAGFYRNFDIDGHASIFSELEPNERAPRAKAVAPLFSMGNLRLGRSVIYGCVDQWIERLREGARSGKPVNVLDLTRALAVDAVTAYLFGRTYGGLDSQTEQGRTASKEVGDHLSASGMVNSFVAVGRYWYLPRWAFGWLEWAESKLYSDWEVFNSIDVVDQFVEDVVDQTMAEKKQGSTYQERLLQAGLSVSEVKAQCKDLMFAGTDSTGMNLATILFMLAKHPLKYQRLREEVTSAQPSEDEVQSLPYLRGVIKEGLRISMANPSRLPRVVPDGGWTFKGVHFPAGTEVSCTPYELHFDAEVFSDPHEFMPERWLEPSEAMTRDAIAFGLGTRQCIARNLATMELYCAVQRLVEEDVLGGARCVRDKIEILEWFNSRVVDEKIELVWDQKL
jgi:cytochrome P450